MKLSLTIIVLYFSLQALHAQTPAKEGLLFDEKGDIISQQVFEQKAKTGNYTWIFKESKDSISARLLLKEEYETITANDREKITEALQEITGKPISENQTIIINFYQKENPTPNQKPCIDHYTSDRVYKNFIHRNKQYFQAFVTTKDFIYGKDFVHEDKHDIIRKLLFKYTSDCGNYIVIKPDGKFYRYTGEYRQDKIPAKLKENW